MNISLSINQSFNAATRAYRLNEIWKLKDKLFSYLVSSILYVHKIKEIIYSLDLQINFTMGSDLPNNYLAFLPLMFEIHNLEFGTIYLRISKFYTTQK
jgi:hypothetical protein